MNKEIKPGEEKYKNEVVMKLSTPKRNKKLPKNKLDYENFMNYPHIHIPNSAFVLNKK